MYIVGGIRTDGTPLATVEMRLPNGTWLELPQKLFGADVQVQAVAFD